MLGSSWVLPRAKSANDAGMIAQPAALGLAVETIHEALIAGQLLREDLESYLAVSGLVIGEIDHPHAALAEPAQDAVFPEPAQLRRIGGTRPGLRRVSL